MKGDTIMDMAGIKAGIIASGSGTDANAVMSAYNIGFIPELTDLRLISTKAGAGCLTKAENQKINRVVIECRKKEEVPDFNRRLHQYIKENNIKLIILAGCVWELYPVEGVLMINIHPADTQKHGGRHMYGLKVHERVLSDIMDIIYREIKNPEDDFETCVTIHEVGFPIDQGSIILKAHVKIPRDLVIGLHKGSLSLKDASEILQKHILEYEWILLPAGVRAAARKIMDERRQGV
jgi:phosphoribosylglycinamide formyltransferase-1